MREFFYSFKQANPTRPGPLCTPDTGLMFPPRYIETTLGKSFNAL